MYNYQIGVAVLSANKNGHRKPALEAMWWVAFELRHPVFFKRHKLTVALEKTLTFWD